MSVAVVAEKPAVARDIARVLGASKRGEGHLYGGGYVVTWAIGHLVGLAEPHEIRPDWQRWSRELLPMLPSDWPLVVQEGTREQFRVVCRIINSKRVTSLVCATDAGREGELIFRYIYEAAGCAKRVRRLWISSLTPQAIQRGFESLRDGRELDALADAARGRSRADWLVGMNLSRACTLSCGETLSVGRVQTPTLAMLVERELAIQDFVPEDYVEVVASFSLARLDAERGAAYQGTYFQGKTPTPEAKRLPADGEEARRIVARAEGRAEIESVRAQKRSMPPPLLYDLTELQRHANRLYGFSARQTLSLAQSLYEQHKLISYPRTGSRHLSQDVGATLGDVVRAVEAPYRDALASGTGARPLGRRFVDDTRVTDHHAIIPTTVMASKGALSADERKLHDLICRRFLQAWHADHVSSVTTVITVIGIESAEHGATADRYHSTGSTVEQLGWKALDVVPQKRRASGPGAAPTAETPSLPPGLARAQRPWIAGAKAVARQTRPPKRFTDATLLTAMETAGKTLDDERLSDAMRECGLGTPATRAEIIETLLRREYVERRGKALHATAKGIRLIDVVHPKAKSPALTGEWEAQLRKIQRGEATLPPFMRRIETFVSELVDAAFSSPSPVRTEPPGAEAPAGRSPETAYSGDGSPRKRSRRVEPIEESGALDSPARDRAPTPIEELGGLLRSTFRLSSFRPHQENVCRAVTSGQDVLLVMPTGAGKSLCYQLPGLARGGTTLVISPLIALMEDQVAQLQKLNLRAERIHSGRARGDSRRVVADYVEGRLDFLFIAPERLAVRGFSEALARREPTLVAVDEAHCISHWGHDFRPDYRLLGERLPQLRSAPVIALTATATPQVQDDIAVELGIPRALRFIHGFRRTNIAVEMAEVPLPDRRRVAREILTDRSRRPAIVYAPTRKEADALGAELNRDFPAGTYHAGMAAPARDRVQAAFIGGELEVVVATIAFGMGVDKADVRTVIHTGLPGSLEAYYQEIGRVGRDGAPSRAILLYSYADRRTHEFFHNRDYPEPEILGRIFAALGDDAQPGAGLMRKLGMDEDVFASALDKLWIHGGARIDPEQNVARGGERWRTNYPRQRDHKLGQLDEMMRCAQSHGCRMLRLVRHFGDQEDSGEACGQCDGCAPEHCLVHRFRPPTSEESAVVKQMIDTLRDRPSLTTGQLYSEACGEARMPRRAFEVIVGGLASAGLLELVEDSFEKEGRTIHFSRAALTTKGRHAGAGAEAELRLMQPQPRKSKGRAAKGTRRRGRKAVVAPTVRSDAPADLVAALKSWRLGESHRRRVPAFRILTDRTLTAVAAARPRDEEQLLAVSGIGPTLARKYGQRILSTIAGLASARRRGRSAEASS